MTNKKLKAGFGEADITPEGRVVELNGQYYQRIAEGVHSRLKTVVLLIEQEEEFSLMIALDAAGVPEDFCERVKQSVSQAIPEVRAERIIINATHTHNAPALNYGRGWWKPDGKAIKVEEFRAFVEGKIVEACKSAYGSRKVTGISHNMQFARVGHCRRALYSDKTAEMYGETGREDFIGMEGGEDSGVELMFLFAEGRQPFGAVVNVACPSQVMEATRVISSDYMGGLREKLKNTFGEDFKTICQISAAGCQSPRDLTRNNKIEPDFWNEDGVEVIAARLHESVHEGFKRARENIEYEVAFQHCNLNLELPLRRVTYVDYIKAKKDMRQLESIMDSEKAYGDFCMEMSRNEKNPGSCPPFDSKLHHFVKIREKEAVIKRYEEQYENPFIRIEVHCLRLGKAVFATNPFELFLDYGQTIKARSKAGQTFVIQLANGSNSYLPTENAQLHGGYGALVMNGKVGSDGGSKLVDETVDAVNGLFQGGRDESK